MKRNRPGPPTWQSRLLSLNRRQTHALAVGFALLLFLGVYPPWEHKFMNEIGGELERPAGYHYALSPPALSGSPNWTGADVDWTMLGVQWLVCLGLTAAAVYGFRDRSPGTQRPPLGYGRP